jgi:uncharacterized SAM-binding protein YcdF (DUF218 family)
MSFLFLSKLLPLLIYPVGLACICLFWSLYLCFKRSRWTFMPILLALILLITAGNTRVSNQLLKSLEWQNLPVGELPQAEAIVILGGATRSASPPRSLPDMSDRGDRLLYGVKLYKDGKAPLIILSGGRIQWFGGGASEAQDMAQILELMGISQEAIVLEPNSLNTYENAINTQKILQNKGIKRFLLVTSAFHMPRSLLIFQRLGMKPIPAPTDFLISRQELEETSYSSESKILSLIPDSTHIDDTTTAIKEYIGMFIYRLRGWI